MAQANSLYQGVIGLLFTMILGVSGFVATKVVTLGETMAGLSTDVSYLKTKTLGYMPRETSELRFLAVEGRLTNLEKYANNIHSTRAEGRGK